MQAGLAADLSIPQAISSAAVQSPIGSPSRPKKISPAKTLRESAALTFSMSSAAGRTNVRRSPMVPGSVDTKVVAGGAVAAVPSLLKYLGVISLRPVPSVIELDSLYSISLSSGKQFGEIPVPPINAFAMYSGVG